MLLNIFLGGTLADSLLTDMSIHQKGGGCKAGGNDVLVLNNNIIVNYDTIIILEDSFSVSLRMVERVCKWLI